MAVAALAAGALAPGSAAGASLFADDGDGLEPGLPVAYAPAGGPVTVDVPALHPDLAVGAVGRIHRDSTAHLGLVRARFVGPGGSTLGAVGSVEPLLLGTGSRRIGSRHRFVLPPRLGARVRAGGVRLVVTAQSRLVVDGRSRPVEVVSSSRTRDLPIAGGVPPELGKPRCEAARSIASAGRTTRIAVRCDRSSPKLSLATIPKRGRARLVGAPLGRAIIDYTPPPGFMGTTSLRVRATNEWGSTTTTRTIAVRPFRLRALGDSVTGGFGFLGDGSEWSFDDLIDCIPPSDFNDRCTSNSPNGVDSDAAVAWLPDYGLSNNVAWPAQFANANGISGPAFANHGVSGSRPQDWDSGGMFNGTLGGIVASRPDLTVMTLGANPLLDIFLTGRGIGCAATLSDAEFRKCVRGFIAQQKLVPRLRSVLAQLLVAPTNRVVVSQYHSAIPSSSIFSVASLRIMFQELNGAVRNAARGAPGFGTRIFLMAPPLFPAGLPPGEAICTTRDTGTLVDGQSRQSRVTQDELAVLDPLSFCGSEEYWIISQDTGIHPSRAGHAQFAAALQRVVDENDLMPERANP